MCVLAFVLSAAACLYGAYGQPLMFYAFYEVLVLYLTLSCLVLCWAFWFLTSEAKKISDVDSNHAMIALHIFAYVLVVASCVVQFVWRNSLDGEDGATVFNEISSILSSLILAWIVNTLC